MSYKIKRFNKLKLFGLAGGSSEEISNRDLIAYKIFVKTPSGYKSKIGEEAYKKNKLYEASDFNGPKNELIGEGYFHSFPTRMLLYI
jgi:hypothetical protein